MPEAEGSHYRGAELASNDARPLVVSWYRCFGLVGLSGMVRSNEAAGKHRLEVSLPKVFAVLQTNGRLQGVAGLKNEKPIAFRT